MDDFRKNQHKHCGNGGIHCGCCNYYNGKKRAKLNRMARAKMKADELKVIKENIEKGGMNEI